MRTLNKSEYKLLCGIFSLKQQTLKNTLSKFLRSKYKTVQETKEYLYAEGDIPIALVAHMDTVFKFPPENVYYDTSKNVMWSPEGLGADDRAGVFAILSIIKDGYRPHIIFTTDEEIGGIGAEAIAKAGNPFKDLRYIIELDRRGTSDCVFYDCANPQFVDYVEKFGFQEEWGSYSDISEICPEWKIAGVNLSVGYQREHSVSETLHVAPLLATIDKVKKMLSEENIPTFKYIPAVYNYGYNWSRYNKNFFTIKCAGCGKMYYEEELTPVQMLDGTKKMFCSDCVLDENNNFEFCECCYECFEFADKDNIPAFCEECEEKAIMRGFI